MGKPKIRFEGYSEDWEQRKFSDIAARESSVSTSASDIPSVEYEDVVAEEGRLNKDIRLKEAVKSGITFDGSQVLYGKLRPYLHNWLNPDFKGIAVGDWWVLKPINMDKHFLYRLIQTQQFDNIANQSSGSKMPRADWNLISNSEFMVPFSKEEQSKIGRSFDSLDQLITLHQCKCDETKTLKKYMLQKMFPQNGEKAPEIRFDGFMEDWEQRKLGDLIEDNIIIEQSDGNHGELYPRSDEFTDAGIPYIAASAISSSGDDIDFNLVKYLPLKRAEQFRKGVAQNGDILLAHNATVGPCLQLSMEYDFAILSTSLTLFRINENKMNSKFFLQMLRSDLFQNQLFKYMKQTTRSQVPILTQRKLEVCYPNNTQDQELIGIYLSNLDHLITLHQRKCDELRSIKKFMLQNMFI